MSNLIAFPSHGSMGEVAQEGMSLRDYFAAKAMQAIVSVLHQGIRPADLDKMTSDAYVIADTMLKARESYRAMGSTTSGEAP